MMRLLRSCEANSMIVIRTPLSIMAILVSVVLSGCSGGGGGSTVTPPAVETPPVVVVPPVTESPPVVKPYEKNLLSSYEASRTDLWIAEPEGSCLAVGYADFDGDKREDYVCGSVTGTTAAEPVRVYSRGATGETWKDITASVFSGPVMTTVHARKVAIADFNGDGKPDLLIADHGYDQSPFPGAPLRLALSQPDEKLKVVHTSYAVNGFYHAAAAADINGDGAVDIVATDNFHSGVIILINDGHGAFTVDTARLPAAFNSGGRAAFTTELIDVDKDGAVDLLVGGHDDKSPGTMVSTIFWNNGTGHFTDGASTVLPYPTGYGVTLDFDVADLDGDGNQEVVMNHTTLVPFYQGFRWSVSTINGRVATDSTAKWFGNVFDSGLGKCSTDCYTPAANWTKWLRIFDHDGDGKLDLLVTDQSRNLWFKNTGSALAIQ
jgi:hypothetical protein